MKNLLGLSSGFFVEPTKDKWRAAVKAGLTEAELAFEWKLQDGDAFEKAKRDYVLLTESGVNISSCHLPFGAQRDISALDEPRCGGAMIYTKKLLDWIASKNIGMAVIHQSFEPIGEAERPARLAKAAENLRELGRYAKERGIVLAAEDLPRTCLGNCADEMLALTDNGRSASICFDVNHLLNESQKDFYEKTAPYVVTTHLSDYDGIDERHWLPGDGCIDWRGLARMFEARGYTGRYIFELHETEAYAPKLGRGFSPAELAERFQRLTKA